MALKTHAASPIAGEVAAALVAARSLRRGDPAIGSTITTIRGRPPRKAKAMHENQRVADTTTVEVLAREASAHAAQTGIPFEAALKAVLETKVDRQQFGELFDESHRGERAERWQEDLTRERVEERDRARREERSRVRRVEKDRAQLAAWESFMREERREVELRKDGQLGRLLGEPLPGESPAALQRLAAEDRRQAEEGLVALMSNGKVFYKRLEDLLEGDVPARDAAKRLRTTWLKERRDGWLGRGRDVP